MHVFWQYTCLNKTSASAQTFEHAENFLILFSYTAYFFIFYSFDILNYMLNFLIDQNWTVVSLVTRNKIWSSLSIHYLIDAFFLPFLVKFFAGKHIISWVQIFVSPAHFVVIIKERWDFKTSELHLAFASWAQQFSQHTLFMNQETFTVQNWCAVGSWFYIVTLMLLSYAGYRFWCALKR